MTIREKILEAIEKEDRTLAEEFFDYMLSKRDWAEGQALRGKNQRILDILDGEDLFEAGGRFINDLIRWKKGEDVHPATKFSELELDDDVYDNVLKIFDRNIFKARVEAENKRKTGKKYRTKLKEKFDAYHRGEIEDIEMFWELQKLADTLKYRKPKRRGQKKAGEALVEKSWFGDPDVQKDYELTLKEDIMLWLKDKEVPKCTDLDQTLKLKSYSELDKKFDWWYQGVIKIFDHISYYLGEQHIPADVIAARLEEVFDIPMIISMAGRIGSWGYIEAKRAMVRQELKMIREMEGTRDLDRKLYLEDEKASTAAFSQLNKVVKHVQTYSYRVPWIYMTRHPESPLWYLLGVMEPREFEYYFIVLRLMNLAPSEVLSSRKPEKRHKAEVEKFKKDIEEAVIRNEVAELRAKDIPYERISIILNENSKGYEFEHIDVTDEQKLRNLFHKEKKFRTPEVLERVDDKTEVLADAETDWKRKVLHTAKYFHYRKAWERTIVKEMRAQKEQKEYTEKPEAPNSYIQSGDIVEDGANKE